MSSRLYRHISQVPVQILLLGLIMLLLQIGIHLSHHDKQEMHFQQLTPPYHRAFYQIAALGSNRLLSYLLTIDLQLHDNQGGKHLPYTRLDYVLLSQWLKTAYDLYPESEYPAFLASRIYTQVKDKSKIRIMIAVIESMFRQNPGLFWRRMTEACLLAKHQLGDLNLALQLAEKVALLPRTIKLPYWARDMRLILLDDLDQNESAAILIANLLQSGEIQDNDERRFLKSRLLKIQQKLSSSKQ